MRRLRFIARRRLVAALAAAAVAAGAAGGVVPSTAAASTAYATDTAASSNWAGYVTSGAAFSRVSGTWVVPRAKRSSEGYSATWVGLGGGSESSTALEQVGTESDYVDGQATYFAWYELVPKAPVKLKLAVHPGDRVTAKVTVDGATVTVSLFNLTTGRSAAEVLHMADPDTSSAEWIAEAPSATNGDGGYAVLPLADFGKVTFTGATATAHGHTGSIADSHWTTARIDLVSADTAPAANLRAGAAGAATTSDLTHGGSSFSVSRSQIAASDRYANGGGWHHPAPAGF